jgi:hypothetical protein
MPEAPPEEAGASGVAAALTPDMKGERPRLGFVLFASLAALRADRPLEI